MKTSDFDYDLPPRFIAQHPAEPRDSARLLIYDRSSGELAHRRFHDVVAYISAGDVLVVNQTRVIPARLKGVKVPSGGKMELLLLKRTARGEWEAMVGGKGMRPGRRFEIRAEGGAAAGEVIADLGGARRLLRFDEDIREELAGLGQVPLPPYITAPLEDPERYQTVYARPSGSAAAPTAGLHFTPGLLDRLEAGGVRIAKITLHVGLDTFAPVREEDPSEHKIHSEWCSMPPESAERINQARRRGGRIICVGTTSVRTVETAAGKALPGDAVAQFEGPTDLYILPGYRFRAVDAMVTNFHLPKSTLLMMVSAFAGREAILDIYEKAKDKGYRFYSFGDAMWIG